MKYLPPWADGDEVVCFFRIQHCVLASVLLLFAVPYLSDGVLERIMECQRSRSISEQRAYRTRSPTDTRSTTEPNFPSLPKRESISLRSRKPMMS